MTTRDDAINVYTDGSCLPSPRSGGIGIRIITFDANGSEIVEDSVELGYPGATNNQMELLACTKGIELAAVHPKLPHVHRICVFTDSRYVVDNISSAKFLWPKQQWRTKDGTPVLNAQLWKDFLRAIKNASRRVEVQWVKGHSRKNLHNKAVDRLAKQSAKVPFNPPLTVVNVRRKKTTRSVQRGSVPMQGQRVAIRIVTSEYLSIQRVSKYKYEVLSTDSPYHGLIDLAFSTEHLRVGHHYEVKFNSDRHNPTIVEVLKEIDR